MTANGSATALQKAVARTAVPALAAADGRAAVGAEGDIHYATTAGG
jgi:hypothetical protein